MKFASLAQTKLDPPVTYQAPSNFRVVGYLSLGHIRNGRALSLNISNVNYVDVFYENLDARNKFYLVQHLRDFIAHAHHNNVVVLGSIGNELNLSLLSQERRKPFIDSLVTSMKNLQYDGIDIDLEGENIDGNYEGFIDDLSKALKSEKKLLTAAISTSEAQKLTNKALAHFDFLSIMSYDNVPYQEFFLPLPLEMKKIRLFHPSQHSSMNLAIHDLNFWTNARHISREKLNLGIPFYGYYFANGRISKLSYRTIMLQHPGMQDSDTIRDQKGILIYNGIPTIRQKTELAKSYVGGIMLWELMEDTTDETSLLKAANQVLNLTEK